MLLFHLINVHSVHYIWSLINSIHRFFFFLPSPHNYAYFIIAIIGLQVILFRCINIYVLVIFVTASRVITKYENLINFNVKSNHLSALLSHQAKQREIWLGYVAFFVIISLAMVVLLLSFFSLFTLRNAAFEVFHNLYTKWFLRLYFPQFWFLVILLSR